MPDLLRTIAEARERGATELDLSSRGIHELPPEIGTVESLVRLDVSGNSLRALPDELGRLRNLRTLHVCENALTALPRSLADVAHIEDVCIAGSALGQLPDWIGQLHVRGRQGPVGLDRDDDATYRIDKRDPPSGAVRCVYDPEP